MQYVFSDFRLQYSQGLQDYRLHSKDIKQMFTTIEQRRKPSNTIAIESLSYSPLPNKRQIGGGGEGGGEGVGGGARGAGWFQYRISDQFGSFWKKPPLFQSISTRPDLNFIYP